MELDGLITVIGKTALAGTLLFSSGFNIAANIEETKSNEPEMQKISEYSMGMTDEDGGVAEIVKYNEENGRFYVINGKAQTIDIVNLEDAQASDTVQTLQREKTINLAESIKTENFQYGDITSIDINNNKDFIAAVVQDKDYKKNGKIVVMDYDGNVQQTYDAGVQPDMVTITKDGKYILSADEGEPREGVENGVDPEGSVTIVEIETGSVTSVKFDDQSVIEDGVHIRNNGKKADAVQDFEPEYIAVSEDGKKAYVTLQENNAVAAIDIGSGKLLSVSSLGYKDHSLAENKLDAARNGVIELESLPIRGVYMPDAIAHFTVEGEGYLVSANEGDATEWEEFVNVADFDEVKEDISLNPELFQGMTPGELQSAFNKMKESGDYSKLEVLTDHGNDAIYTLGGRSFSIWKEENMELVYDSGSDFEKITADQYPDFFNYSNDDDEMDKRSAKKGPEPEEVQVGMLGDAIYAFVGLERIGGVMTYNITDPNHVEFINYMNSRDFSEKIAGDVSPEGIEFISANKSPTSKPLVLVGNEVSGTVSVYEIGVEPTFGMELPKTGGAYFNFAIIGLLLMILGGALLFWGKHANHRGVFSETK